MRQHLSHTADILLKNKGEPMNMDEIFLRKLNRKRSLQRNKRFRNISLRRINGIADRRKLGYLLNILEHTGRIISDDILEIALRYLTQPDKRRIVTFCLAKAKRIKLEDTFDDGYKAGRDNIEEMIKDMHRNEYLKRDIFRYIYESLNDFCAEKAGKRTCSLQKKLNEIAKLFGLGEIEKEVLLIAYLSVTDSVVDKMIEDLSPLIDVKRTHRDSINNKILSTLSGIPGNEISRALSGRSALLNSALLNEERNPAVEVIDFLDGTASQAISKKYFTEYSGPSIPLEYHTVHKKQIEIVKALRRHKTPDQGVNILLYGAPGTGKTEFARALGKSINLNVYEIKNIDDEKQKDETAHAMFRYRAFLACRKMINSNEAIIVVDEADAVLNSSPSFFSLAPLAEKGQINKLLDESTAFTVWITNRFDGIDESTRRRFDYSIRFDKLTFLQRKRIWEHSIKKHMPAKCLSVHDITALAEKYEISAGGIDIALRNAARIFRKQKSRKEIITLIEGILDAHLKIIDQQGPAEKNSRVNAPDYSIQGLNIHEDLDRCFSALCQFNKYWNSMDSESSVHNMNMLLYGPPGSGKTEFAKYTARLLHRRLIIKRASDLMSCWVGESEKNTREVFNEARRDKAILFIDEADSFLAGREGAEHSWEISFVNEWLTNMENFRGILICATNFKKIMDSAAIRRFPIKLRFDYLSSEGNLVFYDLFFKKMVTTRCTAIQQMKIRSIEYATPGDFKAVYQKYFFLQNISISHDMLIDSLRNEIAEKNGNVGKKIGFRKE
ncbi:MAG: AAA family ATPase [Chitinivibrionales bacterium]|nr:AAA family ATPase [Chitinivibrionales bacterium]